MKRIVVLLAVVILVGGVSLVQTNTKQTKKITETSGSVTSTPQSPNTVLHTDEEFSPNSLTVKSGTTVTFTNQSELPMWVGSNPHPVHTDYSAFDQKQEGASYSFTFTESGSYKYHNHMAPERIGVVIVE